jgi:phage baseplate assembly protein gpV
MIQLLKNAMRLQAQRAIAGSTPARLSEVTSYDPDRYAVKVTIQPEGLPSGWIPLGCEWVGNGWGLFCPPSIGDMVSVDFIDGSLGGGYVARRFYNNEDRPLSVPSGEFWLVHSSGSFLKFTNDGNVSLSSDADLDIIVGGNLSANVSGDVTVTAAAATVNAPTTVNGDLQVNGNITASEEVSDHKGSMDSMRSTYDSHTHPGVQTGGSSTSPPAQQM